MIAEQGKLLAPNGKPSKLNRYQWAQVRTDNFKNGLVTGKMTLKMRQSVVDENGEPMVVYHGKATKSFIFSTSSKSNRSEVRKFAQNW